MVAEQREVVKAASSAEESVDHQVKPSAEEEKKEEEPLPMFALTPVEPLTAEPVEQLHVAEERVQPFALSEQQQEEPILEVQTSSSTSPQRKGLKAYLAMLASRNKAKKESLAALRASNEAKKKALAAKKDEEAWATTNAAVTTQVAKEETTASEAPTAAPGSLAFLDEKADPVPIKDETTTTPEEIVQEPMDEAEETAVETTQEKEQETNAENPQESATKNLVETIQVRDWAEIAKGEVSPEQAVIEKLEQVEDAAQTRAGWTCCGW